MGKSKQNSDDRLVFSDSPETDVPEEESKVPKYKLLIVDDEREVHVMTKLVLSDYEYMGAGLEFLSAYTMDEAKELVRSHPDAAIILLDVVMETKETGLDIAGFIRKEEQNDLVRIILRTGQPGQAPEKDIILNYDINDYKEKTELTTQKLFTSITTALRSYLHLLELDETKKEIAAKNVRLNEEIARRIVAEHNLTKYNRSLEKILDTKTARLKTSLMELEDKKKELQKANILAAIGDVSSATIHQLDFSQEGLKKNIGVMNKYRSKMTLLLEKYEMLQAIIYSNTEQSADLLSHTHESIEDLDQYKQEIDIGKILSRYPEIIEDSNRGIEHIAKAVTDIKLFVSIDEEKKTPADINDLLRESIRLIKMEFSDKIDLQVHLDDLPEIELTPNTMTQAFSEVLKNACQAVGTKGIVSVSSAYEPPDIIVHVNDTGHGVAAEHFEEIFKPYFSADRPGANGLGLSFAKAILKNNQGNIEVGSKPGEGTTIVIQLPADPIR